MAEWKRTEVTTIAEYIRGEEENVLQNQKITALLKDKGRISFNHNGKKLNWKIKKKRNSMVPYGDTDVANMPRVNRHDEAELPVRGYMLSESVTAKEKAQNKGKEAIVKFVADLTEDMMDDVKYDFAPELYKDGELTGNENRIHGFQSCTQITGSDQYTSPSDTYAGLSTILGNYGGAVDSGSWPAGKFDPEYYFWSPLIVNYSHASWAGDATWAGECLEVIRKGIIHQRNIKGKQGKIDLILMTASMYADFLDQIDEKERIQIQKGAQNSALVRLGFQDVCNYDGVDMTYEVDVPDTQAYGFNFESMELCSWESQLFVPDKDFEITTLSDQYALHFFGNMKLNPRAMVLWDDIT